MLGAEGGAAAARAARRRCAPSSRASPRDYGLEIDVDATVGDLSVGLQQRVEILKALYRGADILILDEPTAVLTPAEADALFELPAGAQGAGQDGHPDHPQAARDHGGDRPRLGHAARRDGRRRSRRRRTSPPELAEADGRPARAAAGREGGAGAGRAGCSRSRTCPWSTAAACCASPTPRFTVHAGEIVGIAGVAGNGQSELLEAIAGMRRPVLGTHRGSTGAHIAPDEHNPHRLRQLGLLHVPEDRLRMGLVPSFEAFESAVLGFTDDPRLGAGPLLDHRRMVARPRGQDGALRRAPAGAAAEDLEVLRRQPAEDRARPRDRAPSEGAPRRPADPRRRHRRDRVHPPPPPRPARRRASASCSSRSSSTRS